MSSPKDLYLPENNKLRGADNFGEWRNKIEDKFISRNLEDHFLSQGMKPHPADTSFEIYDAWMLKDTEARMTIRLNVVPEVLQVLRPWAWEANEAAETAFELWARLEYLYGEPSLGSDERHEYLEELLVMDFSNFEQDMNFSSVAPFILRYKKLVSALMGTELQLPDHAYIILFINAFRNSYASWAEQWMKLARLSNSTITLGHLYASITDLDQVS